MAKKKDAKPAHSSIGASSMFRWSVCPGSVRLCEKLPSTQSEYAREGSEAHALAEAILKRELFGKKSDIAEVSAEMEEAVRVYTEHVLAMKEAGAEILIEHRFDLSEHLHREGLFGTADCVAWFPKEKRLKVTDYKHGAGIVVNPERNSQLLYYGLGALLTLNYKAEIVELEVVQPRAQHADGVIRAWSLPAIDLVDFAADLVQFADATRDPNAPLKAGDHCRFCPASGRPVELGGCPELQSKAIALAKTEFSPAVSYNPQALSETLHWLPALKAWISSVNEFAYAEAKAGRIPPGWKLVEKRATRHWNDTERPQDLLRDLGYECEDFLETPTLKSPAQIEKLLKTKLEKTELFPYVSAISSGVTLVPESDKRQNAVKNATAEFTAIE